MAKATVGSSGCSRSPSVYPSLSMESTARSFRSPSDRMPRPSKGFRSAYHILLILIIIVCLSPVSTSAHSTSAASQLIADIPRSSSNPSGDIITVDLQGSSLESSNTQPDNNDRDELPVFTDNDVLRRAIVSATSEKSTTMPEPFDTISNNFANSSCVSFFSTFQANATVMNCHAVSLLLENSNAFFHDLSSATATSRVLNTTCAQPVAQCQSIMTETAARLLQEENCGPDYQANNSIVVDTYEAMMAYEPVYEATCLTNPETDEYCFVDAATNSTNPNDYDVYLVPVGNVLTKGNLTCNQCLKSTMKIYSHWATINNEALDTNYLASAQIVNDYCGAGFAKTNITAGSDNVSVQTGDGIAISQSTTRLVSVLGFTVGLIFLGIF